MRFNPVSKQPKVFFAEITAIEAQEILDGHNTDPETHESTNFRRLSEDRSQRYGADIRHKRWVDGVATIDFDPDGILLNGQHTLRGCVISGRPITVTVRTGLPTEAVTAIDSGKPRTEADAMKKSGIFTAIGRWIYCPDEAGIRKVHGRLDMIAFYQKHEEAITFVIDTCGSARGIRIGPVLAPVARAWYTQDRAKLVTFLRVLASNQAIGPHANIVLRHGAWLREEPVRGARRIGAYWRTEKVLWNYLNGRAVNTVVQVGQELFELPADKRMK